MTQITDYNKTATVDYTKSTTSSGEVTKRKKSGCGCFFLGCFGLLALILLPLIGGGLYIYSMDSADWGAKVVSFVTDPSYSSEIRKGIEGSSDMDAQQKEMILKLYDKFLADYNQLTGSQQEIIHRNIFTVIKKMVMEPEKYEGKPPEELLEIIKVLGFENEISQIKTLIKDNKITTDQTLPQNLDKALLPDEDTGQDPSTNKTQYDF